MRKQSRVALVTGGAKRVGLAIVYALHEAGFEIAFTYHESQKTAQQIAKKLGRKTLAIQANLIDSKTASDEVFEAVRKHFGRLDVLVNSASIYLPGDEALRKMFAIHVETPLLLCRRFEKYLRKSKGHVVNMVDLLAERPWPKFAAYSSTKAGLWNLTLSLARELAPQVTVNGIAPGVIAWPEGTSQAEKDRYLQRVPLARSGTPEDAAKLVRFLVTDGRYITGQIIRLDGGRSIV